MLIVDAHLDLAFNALRGRELLRPAAEQAPGKSTPTVALPDLRAGGVELICATIYCSPASPTRQGYRTADEAADIAREQLQWYHRQHDAGEIALVRTTADLRDANHRGPSPRAILLMEGADPIRSPAEVTEWFDAGLRAVGLAWQATRHAGGTGAPGPLTADGVALLKALDSHGIIHDLAHLAEESFWQLLDHSGRPVMATHSNCRAIVPTDRQLSDAMIRAILSRGGVIGINFYDKFLLPPAEYGRRRATLADVVRHVDHIAQLAGHARQVGIGSDMDGGFGQQHIPVEIETSADLPRLADALAAAGYSDPDIRAIMGHNWLSFSRASLPQS